MQQRLTNARRDSHTCTVSLAMNGQQTNQNVQWTSQSQEGVSGKSWNGRRLTVQHKHKGRA